MRAGSTRSPSTMPVILHQHVVEQRRRVGQRHALDRRVADVALVPQRLVLERGQGIAAQQPRQAG